MMTKEATRTAKRLRRVEYDNGIPELAWSETLFRAADGQFFLHCRGGRFTSYGSFSACGMRIDGERVIPLSREEARQWLANYHKASRLRLEKPWRVC